LSGPWIVLFVALWLVVIGETVLVLGLSRRLTTLESTGTRVAAGATMGAIPVGTPIPREAADRLAIPSPDAAIRSSVILFLSPGCGPCHKLADALNGQTLGRGPGDHLDIIVVTNEAGAERFSHVGRTVRDPEGTLAKGLGVPGTPFGFAIDPQGIIRSIGIVPNALDDLKKLAVPLVVSARVGSPCIASACTAASSRATWHGL
jgi:hypothetical protein